MKLTYLATFLLCAWAAVALAADDRIWHDATGQHSRQAQYEAFSNGRVILKQTDGQRVSILWDKLSADDRTYVTQLEAQRKAADPFRDVTIGKAVTSDGAVTTAVASSSEELPTATLANFLATAMQTEGLSFNPATVTAPPNKYVYYGQRSTTHLLDSAAAQGIGTIHYCLRHGPPHPCGSTCRWHLALLFKINEDSNFFYYQPLFGDPNISKWAFSRDPDHFYCRHSIWCQTRAGWQRFDRAHRVHPR